MHISIGICSHHMEQLANTVSFSSVQCTSDYWHFALIFKDSSKVSRTVEVALGKGYYISMNSNPSL